MSEQISGSQTHWTTHSDGRAWNSKLLNRAGARTNGAPGKMQQDAPLPLPALLVDSHASSDTSLEIWKGVLYRNAFLAVSVRDVTELLSS